MPPRTKPLKVLHISPKELYRLLKVEAQAKKMAVVIRDFTASHGPDCECLNCNNAHAVLKETE